MIRMVLRRLLLLALVAGAGSAFAQRQQARHDEHEQHEHGGAHHAPPHGPTGAHEGYRLHEGERPHVENDHWLGHYRSDQRFYLEHPYAQGHFGGHVGAGQFHKLHGFDPYHQRFFIDGGFFVVAPFELPYLSDWTWGVDQIVLYPDQDHPGWYLAYNTRTGNYVHVRYDGLQAYPPAAYPPGAPSAPEAYPAPTPYPPSQPYPPSEPYYPPPY
jgi:hypothetical protein